MSTLIKQVVTDQIEVDYQKLIHNGTRLEELANQLEQLRKRELEQLGVTANWSGDAGKEFAKKTKKLDKILKSYAKQIQKTGTAMRVAGEGQKRIEETITSWFR